MEVESKTAAERARAAYTALRTRLDEFPLGAPPHESLDEILAELFTPDEAEIAARLPSLPTPLPELARKVGLEAETLKDVCETLADRGLVFAAVRDQVPYYSLLPLVPGIFELQFMKAETTPRMMQLARLFNTYYYAGWGHSLTEVKTPWPRVVAVERQIPAGVEVLPYERVSELIKSARKVALTNCYCRHEANLLGKGCGAPLDVCMVFGRFAEFCVERGFAAEASVEEALEALDRAEEAGLVHVTDNCQERLNFLCNCCGCCCGILRGITELDRPTAVATSSYIVALAEDDCAACGECVERCHVKAIKETPDGIAIDKGRCIGCGLCNLVCPTGALTMERREDPPVPPRRWRDLQAQLMAEKRAAEGADRPETARAAGTAPGQAPGSAAGKRDA